MDRISINLLPLSLKEDKKLQQKKKLINKISIAILGLLIVITSGLIAMSILQNQAFEEKSREVTTLENKLSSLKENEAAATLVKKRLATIKQIQTKQYPQADSFILITSLLPPNITLQTFSVDKANEMSVQGNANTAADMQKFFDNLSDPRVNEGKITKTTISNLSRGPTPRLIFDLLISTNFGGTKK